MALDNPRFNASYERVLGAGAAIGDRADAFFRRFYEIFLERPNVSRLFAGTDMQRQVQMLRRSFYQLVTFHMLNEPTPELARLASLHAHIGVTAALFDEWLEALLATVEERDPECDEATRLAWCWALSPGLSYMKMSLVPGALPLARHRGP